MMGINTNKLSTYYSFYLASLEEARYLITVTAYT